MKVFTTTAFKGHYPVGVSAVIIANDRGHASRLLDQELPKVGLPPQQLNIGDFHEVSLDNSIAIILQDGDY